MRAMVGTEEMVDPPVVTRPLPFSRAWFAAFVLALIAIGWTAVLIDFDTRSERAHVDRLAAAVGGLEKAIAEDEGYTISRRLDDLATVSAGRVDSGAEEIDRMWSRVDLLTKRAQDLAGDDLVTLAVVVDELKSVSSELDAMVTIPSQSTFVPGR